jgi:RNA methyltransferase, TrmH family
MQSITSRQNPLVRACRDLAATPAADGARVLLDGTHLVRAALSAGIEIELLLVASSRLMRETEEGALALDLERRLVQVVQASDSIVATASPVRTSSGILAIARRTQAVTARDVFSHPQACVVAAVDIQDPGNVGALLRVAEAGGATGVCVGRCGCPLSSARCQGRLWTR